MEDRADYVKTNSKLNGSDNGVEATAAVPSAPPPLGHYPGPNNAPYNPTYPGTYPVPTGAQPAGTANNTATGSQTPGAPPITQTTVVPYSTVDADGNCCINGRCTLCQLLFGGFLLIPGIAFTAAGASTDFAAPLVVGCINFVIALILLGLGIYNYRLLKKKGIPLTGPRFQNAFTPGQTTTALHTAGTYPSPAPIVQPQPIVQPNAVHLGYSPHYGMDSSGHIESHSDFAHAPPSYDAAVSSDGAHCGGSFGGGFDSGEGGGMSPSDTGCGGGSSNDF